MDHVFKYKDILRVRVTFWHFERVITQSIVFKKEPVCFTLVPGHRNQNAEAEQIYIWKKSYRYLKILTTNMCFHRRIWKAGTPFSCNKVILCHQHLQCVIARTMLLNFGGTAYVYAMKNDHINTISSLCLLSTTFNMPSLNFISFFFF